MSIQTLRQLVARGQVATCREIEIALAEYDRLRAALEKIEKWLAGEDGPLCRCCHTWDEHKKPKTKISWDVCSFPCEQCECPEYDRQRVAAESEKAQ